MQRRRAPRFHGLTALLLAAGVAVGLAGCDAGSSTAARAITTPAGTAAPRALPPPAIQMFALKDFAASFAVPGTHGLILSGAPVGAGTSGGLVTTLYYAAYDDPAHAVRPLATSTPASDGTQRQISVAGSGGDWVAYLESDTLLGRKALSVINVVTGERHLVFADDEGPGAVNFLSNGPVVMDDHDLVYGAGTAQGGGIFDYQLASGTARRLDGVAGFPVALSNGTLLYTQASGDQNGPGSTWSVALSQPAPTKLAAAAGYNYAVNARYIAWDTDVIVNGAHSEARTLALYDRATGKQLAQSLASCGYPSLAADRPYLLCQDQPGGEYQLIQVSTGASVALGITGPNPAQFVGDRAYFLMQSGSGTLQVAYLDAPAS